MFVHIGVAVALAAAVATATATVRDVMASGSGTPSVFVPIVPCRLADTRAGDDNVGPRTTPIGAAESYSLMVWGSNGNCSIPNTATGIASNVTAVGPTAASYLTVFPADANPRPTASNLNVTSTSPPTPNQVTVALSATGAIAVYNNTGSVNVVVDIVGYYQPSTGGTPGPQGPPGPSGVTPQDVIWVAKSGGQFTMVSAAINSITDSRPHVIKVAPGTYVETSTITLKNNVDLEGSGQNRTTITCACAIGTSAGTRSTVYASGGLSSEIRDLTITNSGGPVAFSSAVELNGVTAAMSIVDTTLTATNPTAGTTSTALQIVGSVQPHIDTINTYTAGAPVSNDGVSVFAGGAVVIRNSWIYISGTGYSVRGNGDTRLVSSTVNGATTSMSGRCDLVLDVLNNPVVCA